MFVLLSTTLFAQEEHGFGVGNPSIRFKEGSAALSEDQKTHLDDFFRKYFAAMKNNDTLYFFKKADFVMQSYTTTKEQKKNRLIGMNRCVVILDYIEKKYNISRGNFHLVDCMPIPNGNSYVYFFFTRK